MIQFLKYLHKLPVYIRNNEIISYYNCFKLLELLHISKILIRNKIIDTLIISPLLRHIKI